MGRRLEMQKHELGELYFFPNVLQGVVEKWSK